MNFIIHEINGSRMSELTDKERIIADTGDMLDVIANSSAGTVLIHKSALNEDFFDLSTGFAGEILQKVSNYNLRLGIIGDFSAYSSKSLKDFIYESNRNRQVVFSGSVEDAIDIFTE